MRELKPAWARGLLAAAVRAVSASPQQQADGVYQPLPPAWLQWLLLGAGLAAAALIVAGPGGPWMSQAVPVGLAVGFGLRAWLERRRHGPAGRPLVRLSGEVLQMRHVGADVSVPLSQLAHLVVYGPAGYRHYRFIQPDGRWQEARPQWPRQAEACVIAFLQRALGERVVVEAPQTAFEQARGDGPYFGS